MPTTTRTGNSKDCLGPTTHWEYIENPADLHSDGERKAGITVKRSHASATVSGAISDPATSTSAPLKALFTFAQIRDRYESDPHRKAAIQAKRRVMAHMLGNGLKRPLVTLTLSAGLSQADVAERLGTSQRFIAQLASGAVQNVEADILEKLGIALDVSAAAVKDALEATPLSHSL